MHANHKKKHVGMVRFKLLSCNARSVYFVFEDATIHEAIIDIPENEEFFVPEKQINLN